MNAKTDDDTSDIDAYRVFSRREIISLLRNINSRNQLVRMHNKGGSDSAVTSVLHVDDAQDAFIVDCAPSALINHRILASSEVYFETLLDNIRILFSVSHVEECAYEGRPALRLPIPESLVRLQRRENYRVMALVSSPVRCMIPVPPAEPDGKVVVMILQLYNVSAGGIAVVDEKKQLNLEFDQLFNNCRIDLPGGAVTVSLRFRNARDLTLSNGKNIRRLGFMFENPPSAVSSAIQRYITRLEREQNARATGLA